MNHKFNYATKKGKYGEVSVDQPTFSYSLIVSETQISSNCLCQISTICCIQTKHVNNQVFSKLQAILQKNQESYFALCEDKVILVRFSKTSPRSHIPLDFHNYNIPPTASYYFCVLKVFWVIEPKGEETISISCVIMNDEDKVKR